MWKTNINQLWQVISYARRIFYKIEESIETALNPSNATLNINVEAAKLYKENFDIFQAKVATSLAACNEKLFDPPKDADDKNSIIFGPWNPDVHESLRRKLISDNFRLTELEEDSIPTRPAGLSWMQRSSNQTFSKSAS